jgi:hypothetical protein
MPSTRSLSQIKSALLNPATTSHFEVTIPKPPGFSDGRYLNQNGVKFEQDKLNLLCSDAILPGSTFTTHDIAGDYHGTIHRHAYRRLYDDRIDLSFYVDAQNYLPIRYFETWMKYIAGEQIASSEQGRPGISAEDYFYRMNYPDLYIAKSGLTVTKFERSSFGGVKGNKGGQLVYNFVNAFPISIQSMAVSYDSSSLLKCTVSFSYIRYYVNPPSPTPDEQSRTGNSLTYGEGDVATDLFNPGTQASLNGSQFQTLNSGLPAYDLNQSFSTDASNSFSFGGK